MRYIIDSSSLGSRNQTELTPQEYKLVVSARESVLNSCYIEEKFAYVIGNYLELESDAFSNTVGNTTGRVRPFPERVQDIHLFNRRIINLLTTCRLYLDHVAHHFSYFDETIAERLRETFAKTTKRCYDEFFSYRLLEALRNLVQHRALPLSEITRNTRVIDIDNPQLGSESTILFVLAVCLDARTVRRGLQAPAGEWCLVVLTSPAGVV